MICFPKYTLTTLKRWWWSYPCSDLALFWDSQRWPPLQVRNAQRSLFETDGVWKRFMSIILKHVLIFQTICIPNKVNTYVTAQLVFIRGFSSAFSYISYYWKISFYFNVLLTKILNTFLKCHGGGGAHAQLPGRPKYGIHRVHDISLTI